MIFFDLFLIFFDLFLFKASLEAENRLPLQKASICETEADILDCSKDETSNRKIILNGNFSSRGFDVLLLCIYVRRGIRTSYVVVMAVCVFMKSNSVVR